MSRIFIIGGGAVSSAGWGVRSMREALRKGQPLPIQDLERPGWSRPLRARFVPNPAPRPAFLGHPRLRRASPITHYAAAAALEAMAALPSAENVPRRLGLIVCLQAGCVQYSFRFFKEALEDPATASPLFFPETVFAAPASHVAALLPNTQRVYTLVADPAGFVQGLAAAAAWLEEDRVDACFVIGAEEINWLRADALWHFDRSAIISGGAGALCLSRQQPAAGGVELTAITQAHTFTTKRTRLKAAQAMRAQLGDNSLHELLCDGIGDSPRTDAPEAAVWHDYPGPRISPKKILGEGLMAAAAWQCVAAWDAVATGRLPAAKVSLVGCNQQAIGMRLCKA